jgi:hypothetical protein
VPAEVGVELIESILASNSILFLNEPTFLSLLAKDVCPLVVNLLRACTEKDQIDHHFPVTLRLCRCIQTIIKIYHRTLITEVEVFLSTIVRMLEPEYRLWHRVLILEIIHSLCCDQQLLYFFFSK